LIPGAEGAPSEPGVAAVGRQAARIDRTALVDPRAQIGADVEIGPFTIVGPDVAIGDGTRVGANCLLCGWTSVGKRCRIFHGAVIGEEPQDVKYRGEKTHVRVGDANIIREFATIHRATGEGNETRVGDRNYIMAYAHVAHNCSVGTGVVLANSVNMAGHVTIEDYVTIGGVTPIHQFVRVGKYSFIGGGSRIPMDIAPFVKVAGNPARVSGLNSIGLQRHGLSPETRQILKQAYKLLFRSHLNVTQAIERIRSEIKAIPEIDHLVAFIENSQRGITL
jgi:UDP-N-acetylglucosamine acyltransferase